MSCADIFTFELKWYENKLISHNFTHDGCFLSQQTAKFIIHHCKNQDMEFMKKMLLEIQKFLSHNTTTNMEIHNFFERFVSQPHRHMCIKSPITELLKCITH